VVSYVLSLRGPEGFLLDLSGLQRYWSEVHTEQQKEYMIIALRGEIKGEHNQREHLLPCSPTTGSGIDVKASINRLITLKEAQGRKSGPTISDEAGVIFSARAMDDALHEVLEHLEYLYVTLRRNSAHRVTEIVTIFGRILYVFTEHSVRFCTVVFDGPAPPGTEFSTNILEFGTCVRLHQYLLCTVFLHKLLEISLHKRNEFSKVSTGLQ
jgi:hypothetical protein